MLILTTNPKQLMHVRTLIFKFFIRILLRHTLTSEIFVLWSEMEKKLQLKKKDKVPIPSVTVSRQLTKAGMSVSHNSSYKMAKRNDKHQYNPTHRKWWLDGHVFLYYYNDMNFTIPIWRTIKTMSIEIHIAFPNYQINWNVLPNI